MFQAHSDEHILTLLIARHLDVDPERLTLGRSPTGKFNEPQFVEGGPVPLARLCNGRRVLKRRFDPATGL